MSCICLWMVEKGVRMQLCQLTSVNYRKIHQLFYSATIFIEVAQIYFCSVFPPNGRYQKSNLTLSVWLVNKLFLETSLLLLKKHTIEKEEIFSAQNNYFTFHSEYSINCCLSGPTYATSKSWFSTCCFTSSQARKIYSL